MDWPTIWALVGWTTVDVLILLYVRGTRTLVKKVLAVVGPWFGVDENGDPVTDAEGGGGRRAVRDKRGRFVRWEAVAPPSGAMGYDGTAGGYDSGGNGPPNILGSLPPAAQALLQQYAETGHLPSREQIAPFLPQIMSALKGEFMGGSGGNNSSAPNLRSRFG
jgi:hypothetical protein